MNKTGLIVILGTEAILVLILVVSNFRSAREQTNQTSQGAQVDSMASHHGGSPAVDAAIFNNLVGKPAPPTLL